MLFHEKEKKSVNSQSVRIDVKIEKKTLVMVKVILLPPPVLSTFNDIISFAKLAAK